MVKKLAETLCVRTSSLRSPSLKTDRPSSTTAISSNTELRSFQSRKLSGDTTLCEASGRTRLLSQSITNLLASRYGSGRKSRASAAVKMETTEAMPKAKEVIAVREKTGFLHNMRRAKRKSCWRESN